MSEQEKYAIVGKLTMDLAEARKRAAFLRQELELTVQAFDALVNSLRPRAQQIVSARPPLAISDKLRALLAEQDEVEARMRALRADLEELGA